MPESDRQNEVKTLWYASGKKPGAEAAAPKWLWALVRLHAISAAIALGLVLTGIVLMPDRSGEWLVGEPMYCTGGTMAGLLIVAGSFLVFAPEAGGDRWMLIVAVASTAISLLTFLLGSASTGSP